MIDERMTEQICAEDILPGHPDRLCDAIAESIVNAACAVDPEALVGVEVALHRSFVAVTGRVAAGASDTVLLDHQHIESIVTRSFESAGYRDAWSQSARVQTDLDVDPLAADERSIRAFSDDQTVAVGFADPRSPMNMPIEAFVARSIRCALDDARTAHFERLGPDGKVLVVIERGTRPRLVMVNMAIQHRPLVGYEELHCMVTPALHRCLESLSTHLDVPDVHDGLDGSVLRLNGIGDFSCGGPMGDNGLSGKKLVVDHYGPHVPIGGGALCGKDPHKPDRVGPLRARQLAVRLARETGETALVHLGWLPGLEAPDRMTARLGSGICLGAKEIERLVSVPDLSLAGSARELELAHQDWVAVMRSGYVGAGHLWDRG